MLAPQYQGRLEQRKTVMGYGMEAVAIMVGKRQQFVSEAQVRQAEAVLAEMAKKPKLLTLQQTLEQLRPKMLALIAKGYTYQDVVEALKANGIQVALSTLRQSLKEKAKEATAAPLEVKARPQAVAKPVGVEPAEAIDVDAAIDAITTEAREELDEFAAAALASRAGANEINTAAQKRSLPWSNKSS
jgi:hypothetical protein